MVTDSLQTVGGIVIMLAIGFVLGTKNLVSEQTKIDANKLVVKLFIPCTVLSGFQNSVDIGMMSEMATLSLVIAIALVSITIFSYLFALVTRVKRTDRGIFVAVSAFPNAGFVGLPVIASLFGDAGTPYAILMVVVGFVICNPLSIYYAKTDGQRKKLGTNGDFSFLSLVKMLVDPLIVFAIVAVALLFLDLKLPKFVLMPMTLLADLTSPVSLLIAGYVLSKFQRSTLKPDVRTFLGVFIRIVCSGALMYGLTTAFGVTGMAQDIVMIQFTLPSMVFVISVCEIFGANSALASKSFVYGTLFSVISMPIYAMLFTG